MRRASEHIDELEAKIAEFSDRLRTPNWSHDPITGFLTFRSPVSADEVEYVAEIVGDAAHCLRAALDRMAVELVMVSGGNEKGVYFPMAIDAANLQIQIKDKKFDRAGADAVALLNSFQPHKGLGGNHPLRELHDLDITDKHKSALHLRQAMVLPTVLHGDNGIHYGNTTISGVGEDVVRRIRYGKIHSVETPDFHPEMPPPLDIIFADIGDMEPKRVVPVFRHATWEVRTIIDSFEALVKARP